MIEKLREMKWVIMTTSSCGYCMYAKELLRERGIEFAEFDINFNPVLKDFLLTSGLKTVPQVYSNGTNVGGYDELKAMIELNVGMA